jgi:hypothetical protein
MSKAHLTALAALLAVGAVAPRLAAQDTSSAAGQARQDTSGYRGAGGVDTSARPGRVGVTDTTGGGGGAVDTMKGGAADTAGLSPAAGGSAASDSTTVGQETPRKLRKARRRLHQDTDTMAAPGRIDHNRSGALGATDSSGMGGRHPDSTKAGETSSPQPSSNDTGAASQSRNEGASQTSDSSGMAQPTTQPGQSTSPAGQAGDTSTSR